MVLLSYINSMVQKISQKVEVAGIYRRSKSKP